MKFNKIDLETWSKKESYLYYLNTTPCTYSMTVNLDITKFLAKTKANNIKFFPAILYAVSKVVNKYIEFRMDLDDGGNVGYYDTSNPSFTIFDEKTENFKDLWISYSLDFDEFLENYENDMKLYQNDFKNLKIKKEKNFFYLSCIPWVSFTGFNLNLPKGYNFFAPIFTVGKYFKNEQKMLLPMAIQVHHAICDGFHLARFINDLQKLLDEF